MRKCKMDIFSFFNGLKWDILKQKLLSAWIEPHKLEWVDFNNMEQLNQLAETIMPEIIRNNPTLKNLLRQNSNLAGNMQKDVVEVIDKL